VKARPSSASLGRDESTRIPRCRAASSAERHNVDLPIPASPSMSSAAGLGSVTARKPWTVASSSVLPTISSATGVNDDSRSRPGAE
jgi:hypothetical protein